MVDTEHGTARHTVCQREELGRKQQRRTLAAGPLPAWPGPAFCGAAVPATVTQGGMSACVANSACVERAHNRRSTKGNMGWWGAAHAHACVYVGLCGEGSRTPGNWSRGSCRCSARLLAEGGKLVVKGSLRDWLLRYFLDHLGGRPAGGADTAHESATERCMVHILAEHSNQTSTQTTYRASPAPANQGIFQVVSENAGNGTGSAPYRSGSDCVRGSNRMDPKPPPLPSPNPPPSPPSPAEAEKKNTPVAHGS